MRKMENLQQIRDLFTQLMDTRQHLKLATDDMQNNIINNTGGGFGDGKDYPDPTEEYMDAEKRSNKAKEDIELLETEMVVLLKEHGERVVDAGYDKKTFYLSVTKKDTLHIE
jgi:hypothetical protein